MAKVNSDIPLINVPVVNANGMVNEAWLLFFIQLWRRTGSASGFTPIEYLTTASETYAQIPIDVNPTIFANEIVNGAPSVDSMSEMLLAPTKDTGYAESISTITIGASPFAYQVSKRSAVQITGGTVSAITLKRGSVSLSINVVSGGIVELNTGDTLTITYTVAPTMYLIPR